ncbi:nitrite reductase small subunit NirD [Microbacterium sp. SLBN-146]|uniref:nitrite reductase small subunit NirD n=1 Tax=Microbacterium sp. SLBN-146 TaxID=2768457 RepID=UPI0011684EC4|nr:nitrite reductase small subunit NirD [Microbacterium sp. SLBN-146]TQJ30931.1 assimilatory nitrite reductase (NAD(P)H) small subunit [Microbacterium sp. SLBN-146]
MTLVQQQPAEARTAHSAWVRVCAVADLETERGRAALVGDVQIALFLLHSGRVHAVSNLDPYSGAHVISRGIVGTRQDVPTVASPMYKQVFDLRTGVCIDPRGKDPQMLQVWPAAVDDGHVLIRMEGAR